MSSESIARAKTRANTMREEMQLHELRRARAQMQSDLVVFMGQYPVIRRGVIETACALIE
jgi:hypothetical protein